MWPFSRKKPTPTWGSTNAVNPAMHHRWPSREIIREIDALNMALHVFTYCKSDRIEREYEVRLELEFDGGKLSAKAEARQLEDALLMAWGIWLRSPLAKPKNGSA